MWSGSKWQPAPLLSRLVLADRLAAMTCHPFRTRARAIAAPNPAEAPVTNAIREHTEGTSETGEVMVHFDADDGFPPGTFALDSRDPTANSR